MCASRSDRSIVEYTIAVCNFEMAETVERSLRSMLDQIDHRFEILVVDGGSTDGSVEILRELAAEDDQLRVVERTRDPDRHLGADRTRAIRSARGETVLTQLDTDNRYYDGVITDFVDIYEQLDEQLDFEFFLSGSGLNAAPRDLLVEIPYRNLARGEDRDLWRRLLAAEEVVWFDHAPVAESIGYERDLLDQIRVDIEEKACDFQAGLSLWSCLRWGVHHERYYILEKRRSTLGRAAKVAYDLLTFLYAWIRSRGRQQFEPPSDYQHKGTLERRIYEKVRTLRGIEAHFGVEIDRERLSERGQQIFDISP